MKLHEIITKKLINESAKYVNKELVKCDTRDYICIVDGCERNAYSSGYCNAHYLRVKKGKDLSVPIRNRKKNDECSVCGAKTNTKGGWGMCSKHYKYSRFKLIKNAIIEYLGGKCKICGNSFPIPCYDFHHVDSSTKDIGVGLMFNTRSIKTICEEVDKCDLICANCHRIIHFNHEIS